MQKACDGCKVRLFQTSGGHGRSTDTNSTRRQGTHISNLCRWEVFEEKAKTYNNWIGQVGHGADIKLSRKSQTSSSYLFQYLPPPLLQTCWLPLRFPRLSSSFSPLCSCSEWYGTDHRLSPSLTLWYLLVSSPRGQDDYQSHQWQVYSHNPSGQMLVLDNSSGPVGKGLVRPSLKGLVRPSLNTIPSFLILVIIQSENHLQSILFEFLCRSILESNS